MDPETSIEKLLTKVRVGQSTVLDLTKELDGTRKLVVEQRQVQPEAPRAPEKSESPRRAHEFYAVAGFADYLGKYGGPHTVLYANPAAECVQAVLDETAPKGFEVVTFKPQVHPRWKPWVALLGETISLDAFVDFIRDNRRAISVPDGRELALALSQVRASTEIKLERGRGKKSLNGLMVKTDIQGHRDETIVELPESLELMVPLYVDSAAQLVELDLVIEVASGGTEITARLSSADLAEARVKAFDGMLQTLRGHEKLSHATFTFGAVKHDGWQYLK